MTTNPHSPVIVDDDQDDDFYTDGTVTLSELEDNSLECPSCGSYCLEPVGNCFQCGYCGGFFTEDEIDG